MTFFNLTSTEIMLLVLLGVIVLGPSRLPHYAARLAELVRRARDLAEGAKEQIRQEMGPAFDDVDWRQLDPRQYDPRRIVREALTEPAPSARDGRPGGAAPTPRQEWRDGAAAARGTDRPFAPGLPVPFDPEAT